MFSLAKVFTPGVAASLLGGSHVKRTRYSYQLTLAWFHVLKVQAYKEYCQTGYGPHEPRYHLLTTKADLVLCSDRPTDVSALSPCYQEAGTRMMLHGCHAAEQGHTKACLSTVDTDVVVLVIHHFHQPKLSELWNGFGSGKTLREIPIHHISQQLGPQRCQALLLFHSFTGCDVTAIFGIGKKNGMHGPLFLRSRPPITQDPTSITLDSLPTQRMESFALLMYSKNCGSASINEARKLTFTAGLKPLESIPPTQHALFHHTKRALLIAASSIPNPSEWGWEWNDRTKAWIPYQTNLQDASEGCSVLLHCDCVAACKGNCKCHQAGLHCGLLCKCEGACTNSASDYKFQNVRLYPQHERSFCTPCCISD